MGFRVHLQPEALERIGSEHPGIVRLAKGNEGLRDPVPPPHVHSSYGTDDDRAVSDFDLLHEFRQHSQPHELAPGEKGIVRPRVDEEAEAGGVPEERK